MFTLTKEDEEEHELCCNTFHNARNIIREKRIFSKRIDDYDSFVLIGGVRINYIGFNIKF